MLNQNHSNISTNKNFDQLSTAVAELGLAHPQLVNYLLQSCINLSHVFRHSYENMLKKHVEKSQHSYKGWAL